MLSVLCATMLLKLTWHMELKNMCFNASFRCRFPTGNVLEVKILGIFSIGVYYKNFLFCYLVDKKNF